jgi:DNA modification methylase
MLFATNKIYADKISRVKAGDKLFLLNMDTNALHGTFTASTDGGLNLVSEAWKGKYPYQVKVAKDEATIRIIEKASKVLSKMGISWKETLDDHQTKFLLSYYGNPHEFDWGRVAAERLRAKRNKIVRMEWDRPRLESTTLWDYPKQSYGKTPKGNNKYAGVTPAFIIYNLVQRYTEPNDLVVDPMAGSGTTLDVCKEEGRKCIAYDVVSTRPEIIQNDARKVPLPENSVDMIFIDSPYGDNIRYNDHPANIGQISAETKEFYDELEKVMEECYRILKPGKILGWLIGDQWVKKKFTPVGFKVYERLHNHFETVDIIGVVRRSQSSNTGIWNNRAIRFNFYLRGFKYLFIVRKPLGIQEPQEKRTVNWYYYERAKK